MRRPTRPGWAVLAGVTAGAVVLGGIAGGLTTAALTPQGTCNAQQVAARALPAVVTVWVRGAETSGSGSGAFISADGLVLTNDHVIAAAVPSGTIEVSLTSGETLPATLVGTDPVTDLAVLKVDRTRLPTLTIAARERLSVGQPVVALGAPLGLSGTVTSGIVSALDRNVPAPKASGGTTVLVGAVQTDAAINPGNSGGPLVTCDGLLIGVNTAISTVPNSEGVAGGGSVGIGFAVPAATAKRISDELVASGRATHPWFGLAYAEIESELAGQLGGRPGLFVQEVTAAGPAATSGLRSGDVILTVNGETATSVGLAWLRATASVGDGVEITYLRTGTVSTTTLTLTEQP